MPEQAHNPITALDLVFLSYSTKDEIAVAEIKSALQNEGLKIFDAVASQREMWGSNIGNYLHELITSRVTGIVVFLSKNYQESRWCKSELEAIEAAAKASDEPPLVFPIRMDDSPVPEGLRDRVYLELKSVTPSEIARIAKERLETCTRSEVRLAALSDEDLYERFVQTRDSAAATLLFERLYPIIRTACSRYGVKGADAEDIAQDTIVSLLHRAPDLKGVRNFKAWVWTVARNSAVHHHRKSLKRQSLAYDEESDEPEVLVRPEREIGPLLAVPDASPSPEEAAETAEHVRMIKEAIDKLPPEEQQLVMLHYSKGLSNDEISQLLSISPTILRVRLYRILRRLRTSLQTSLSDG